MHYKLRVVESLAAARILSRHPGIEVCPRGRITLRDVVGRSAENQRRDGRRTLPNYVRVLRKPSSISGNYDWQMPRWMAKKELLWKL
jgi:hypothetical protein